MRTLVRDQPWPQTDFHGGPSRLTLLRRDGNHVFVRCICGREKRVYIYDVFSGRVVSCGCFSLEKTNARSLRHGQCRRGQLTCEYRCWLMMLARCYIKSTSHYDRYGGRGITVCERWRGTEGFQNFYEDMGRRPGCGYSIERKNVNGHYEKSNCVWATQIEQANNRSSNRLITHSGRTMTIAQWARVRGMSYSKLSSRILKEMSTEDALWPGTYDHYGRRIEV